MLCAGLACAQGLNCDLKDYKALDGLKAEVRGDTLTLEWRGERNDMLRAAFSISFLRKPRVYRPLRFLCSMKS